MEASIVICTNCIVIVVPNTFKEVISIVLVIDSDKFCFERTKA